jgi:NAD(P)-dependent dehydrogenase (short-subunit alcohol dehydrogenase family)
MIPKAPNFRLDGQRALVTGASRGIGFSAAVALAQAGAHVTLAARSLETLEAAEKAFKAAQLSADILELDVTNSQAVDQAIEERAPYQILVNNAGMNRPKHLVDLKNEDIDAVLDLNVKAAFYVTRAVTQKMLAAKLSGSIINISSQMGVVGSPKRTLYCASKHALEGMTKALAWELGTSNIRVNTICPTFIETDMTAGMFQDPEFKKWVLDKIALGRIGQQDEIMGAIVFLASNASSLVTGSALMLDGGWSAA